MSVHVQVRFKGGGTVEEVPADVDDQVDGPLYGQALARLWPEAQRVADAAGVRGLQHYSTNLEKESAAAAAVLGFEDPSNEAEAAAQERALNDVGPWHSVDEAVRDLDAMMEALRREPELVANVPHRDALRNELLSLKLVLLHADERTEAFRLTMI